MPEGRQGHPLTRTDIAALLLDADGVLQRARDGWRDQLAALVGPDVDADAFVAEVFAAEKLGMDGSRDFATDLAEVLRRWGSTADVEVALDPWRHVDVDARALDLIARVRAGGTPAYLATNQQSVRTAYMQAELPYARVLDGAFYSSELGHAKPSESYFTAIASKLDLAPDRLLFIDDNQRNVDGARSAGLHAEYQVPNAGAEALAALLIPYGLPATH